MRRIHNPTDGRGMREYLIQMEAWAANELMVTFTTNETPLGRTA